MSASKMRVGLIACDVMLSQNATATTAAAVLSCCYTDIPLAALGGETVNQYFLQTLVA